MKIKNAYLKELLCKIEELEDKNRQSFDTLDVTESDYNRAVGNELICEALTKDIKLYSQFILTDIDPEEPGLTAFFLKIIWLDDPDTLFDQWSVIDTDNINLIEYSKLAYEKIKDNTIDKSFMKEFKSVVKLLC